MFRAYETDRDRLVAVKVFRLDLTPERAAALMRALEQLIARHIEHRAIAAPIAAGMHAGCAYLAMEYAVGDSLDVTEGAGPVPLPDAASIVDGVAAALDRGAELGVLHERLHPRDIIMSADGTRLTGLGIAEALSSIGMSMPVRRPYAAPEQPSDVYSLAAIAYELVSGRRMTAGGWDELSAEDGPELRKAFAAALSENPRARPRAGEFAAMLRTAARPAVSPDRAADPSGSGFRVDGRRFEAELDVAALDRFADLGDASDLRMEFELPAAPDEPVLPDEPVFNDEPVLTETPLPPSWTAQPPKLFQAGKPEPVSRPWLKWASVIATVLIVCFAGGYGLILRSTRQSAAKTSLTTSPVTSTTVELAPASAPATNAVSPTPSVPPPVPRASTRPSTLPAPTPSRPASGAIQEDQGSRLRAQGSGLQAPVSTATGRGRLMIRSTPAGATVVINGQGRGKTPLAVRDLPLGSYTIHLARGGYAAVDRQEQLTAKRPIASLAIRLKPAHGGSTEPARVQPSAGESRGRIAVRSRPAGARVFVNDRLAGSTPLAIPALPAGPAKVRIEMDGYRTWATTVEVKSAEETVVTASLDRN